MSPNDTWGREGVYNQSKKCHVIFEWPLSYEKQRLREKFNLNRDVSSDFIGIFQSYKRHLVL